MKRILAFGCHPDDVEFMVAGALALLAQEGHENHTAPVPLYDCGAALQPTQGVGYLYYWNALSLTDNFGFPLSIHFGVDIGECFVQHRGHGHPQDNVLRDLLGDFCIDLPR